MPEAPAPEVTANADAPAATEEHVEAEASESSPTDDQPDTGNEVEKWKALARKHEDRAKANADKAKRLDEIEEANKTELERAIARAEAAEAKVQESETTRQMAEWRDEVAEATGVPAAALRGATKEEFEAHAETLKSLIPPTPGAAPAGKQGLEQRGAEKVAQLSKDDLKGMSAEQIVEAQDKGQLDDLMRGER